MVTNVTSLGRSGLYDWIIQRVSAVVLAMYTICILSFLAGHSDLQYAEWHAYFSSLWMKIFTLLALLSLVGHAWVGMWTIATDYLTPMALGKSATTVRIIFQLGCILVGLVYLVWGIEILWGN